MRLAATLLALPLALAATDTLAAQSAERYSLRGGTAAVYNLVGTTRVVPGTGRDVEVEVVPRGPDAARLRVVTGERAGAAVLGVVYPDDRITAPMLPRGTRVQLDVRDDGTFGPGRRVRIERGGGGIEAYADLVVRVPEGQRVRVHLAAGELVAANVRGDLLLDVHGARVRAEGLRGALEVDAGSGDVTLVGVEGDVALDLGSGDAELADVRARVLRVDAGSGDVTGEAVDTDRLLLDLGSGGIRLDEVRAQEIEVDAGSGDVDLALANAPASIAIDGGSGDVTLRVPDDFGASVVADFGSGDFDAALPMRVTRRSRDGVQGTIGDGRTRLRADLGSGDLRIVRR